MSETEKQRLENLVLTVKGLPETQKSYILGYAEGAADAQKATGQEDDNQ